MILDIILIFVLLKVIFTVLGAVQAEPNIDSPEDW
jgi:hypothetical protein|tara:strand:+ start:490 stop:594 length:105 start_codon:yes stop_codon:yes gene_type:complete